MWFIPGLVDVMEVKLNVRSFDPLSEFTRLQHKLYAWKNTSRLFSSIISELLWICLDVYKDDTF